MPWRQWLPEMLRVLRLFQSFTTWRKARFTRVGEKQESIWKGLAGSQWRYPKNLEVVSQIFFPPFSERKLRLGCVKEYAWRNGTTVVIYLLEFISSVCFKTIQRAVLCSNTFWVNKYRNGKHSSVPARQILLWHVVIIYSITPCDPQPDVYWREYIGFSFLLKKMKTIPLIYRVTFFIRNRLLKKVYLLLRNRRIYYICFLISADIKGRTTVTVYWVVNYNLLINFLLLVLGAMLPL